MPTILTLVLISIAYLSPAQHAFDLDYEMTHFDSCLIQESTGPLFAKVENDPAIDNMTRSEFIDHMRASIQGMGLNTDSTGYIKLEILFPLAGSSCVGSVGLAGFHSQHLDLAALIADSMPDITDFTPGSQRGHAVNCQGAVFLSITNGILSDFRLANFSFSAR